jgi:hypothetical protein
MTTTDGSYVYAVLEVDTVINVIVATPAFAGQVGGTVRVDNLRPQPGIGWRYVSGTWSEPSQAPEMPAGPGPRIPMPPA